LYIHASNMYVHVYTMWSGFQMSGSGSFAFSMLNAKRGVKEINECDSLWQI
jgi:hypothetical protein